jgi:hypothetical protein
MELVSCPQQQNIVFAPPFRGWTDFYAMYLVISKTRLFADTDMLRPFVLGFAQPTHRWLPDDIRGLRDREPRSNPWVEVLIGRVRAAGHGHNGGAQPCPPLTQRF